MQETMGRIFNFSGIYTSYSISSGSRSLKIEPYFIAPSESGNYVEVGHNNAYGVTHWGTALMNGFNHLYLMFNENPSPQLSLFYICLKLPMYDRPPFLRGLYLCFDYNYNPVARRILIEGFGGAGRKRKDVLRLYLPGGRYYPDVQHSFASDDGRRLNRAEEDFFAMKCIAGK